MKSAPRPAMSNSDDGLPSRGASANTFAAAEALATAAAAATTAAYAATTSETDYGNRLSLVERDGLDARREKNRLAAKRCRDRKQAHLTALEADLMRQKRANEALSRHVVTLVGLYHQEHKQKVASLTLLHSLATAITNVAALGPQPAAFAGGEAEPSLPSPPVQPLLLSILAPAEGQPSLDDLLVDLEQGRGREEEVEIYARELRGLWQGGVAVAAGAGTAVRQ